MFTSPETTYTLRLPESNFEGPLDLLLHLIEREELDITRVSLAKVTDQYMQYLAAMQRGDPEQMADFLVVAAKLLLIKSRLLLPQTPTTEAELVEDVGDELAQQLIAYRHYKQVALQLKEREREGLRAYARIAPPPKVEPQLDFSRVSLSDLATLVERILAERARAPVGDIVAPLVFKISDKMEEAQQRIARGERLSFRAWLGAAATRIEIIVSFLAVLELWKQRKVVVTQREIFGDLFIEPAPVMLAEQGESAEVSFVEPE